MRVPKTPILDSLKPPRKERWHCFETFYPTFKESIQADELRNGVKITDLAGHGVEATAIQKHRCNGASFRFSS